MSAKVSLEEVARALEYVDGYDDRKTWVEIGMACKSALGEAGRQPWDQWSQRSEKYDAAEQGRAWKGFKADGKITVKTLFKRAIEGGYRPPKPQITAEYDYVDEAGNLLFQVCRLEPGKDGTGKDFLQRRRGADGQWVWKTKGVRLVLFHLPALEAKVATGKGVVIICEGEKDVLNLETVGWTATTNARGALQWRSDYNRYFEGINVVLMEDNDPDGRKRVEMIARNLHGIASAIKIITFRDMPEKSDVSDFLAQHPGQAGFELLGKIIRETAPFDPATAENVIPANATTPEGKTGLPEPYSQSRLADIFDQRHADELRHVEDWNFYLWYNGARWLEKSDKIAIDFAENVAREASERALAEPPSYIKPREARAIGGRGTASAIAGLAANRRSFRSNPADWDQQPHLFNVANGTIDLQTGELREHDRRDLLTKITNIEYSTTATATRWYEYLAQVFAGDIDLCAYVQRLVGYSLTGSQKEKLFVVCQGKQDTGKSIFREIMLALAGDYGQSAPLTLFLEKKHVETNNPEVARLRGMRIVVASESGEGRKFDHEKIKSLTGRETVTGCFKYANPFDFYPTDTKWLFTNYKPLVNWDDGGMWTRLKLLQFLVQFKVGDPDHEMDKGLLDALLKQLPGILAWAVEGAIEWYRDGLREPESVTKAVADYKAEVDTIQPCLDECFEKGPDFTVSATDAFKAFKDWAISTGESYCSQTKFGTQLGRKDFESKRDSKTGRIVWKGLKLRPEVRERLDRMADLFDKKKDDNHRQGRFE